MQEIKSIQVKYIELIKEFFSKEILETSKYESIVQFEKYSKDCKRSSVLINTLSGTITNFEYKFRKLIRELDKYWEENDVNVSKFCHESNLNKITIWPDGNIEELTPKLLMFYDIILIPDPITNLGRIVIEKGFYQDALIYFSIISKLEVLTKADSDFPLIIFFNYKKSNSHSFISKNEDMANLYLESQPGIIAKKAFNEIVGQNLESIEPDSIMEELSKIGKSKLKKDFNYNKLHIFLGHFFENYEGFELSNSRGVFDFISSHRLEKRRMNIGDYISILGLITTNFSIIQTRELNSNKLNSTNLITTFNKPFVQYKNDIISKDFGVTLNIPKENLINYSLNQNFKWLNHIDIKTVLELRLTEDFERFREIMRNTSSKLKTSKIEEFPAASEELNKIVKENVEQLIAKNKMKIDNLEKRRKISTIGFGATTLFTLASLAFPAILPLTIIASGYGIIMGENAKDFINNLLTGNSELKELGKRNMSLLIENSVNDK